MSLSIGERKRILRCSIVGDVVAGVLCRSEIWGQYGLFVFDRGGQFTSLLF